MMDVSQSINAVSRSVGTRTLAKGEARTVTLARIFDAGIEDVWDACTRQKRIGSWFMPVSGDLRLGGRFQIQGNAAGTIERCDPPHSFSSTWEMGGDVSWIEVRLLSVGAAQTRLELEHIAHVDDARWTEFGPGAVGIGWDLTLFSLARHMQSGRPADPRAVAAWSASDDGKRFMTDSNQRWCEANIAAGADPAAARGAASRTIAFYTGSEASASPPS